MLLNGINLFSGIIFSWAILATPNYRHFSDKLNSHYINKSELFFASIGNRLIINELFDNVSWNRTSLCRLQFTFRTKNQD